MMLTPKVYAIKRKLRSDRGKLRKCILGDGNGKVTDAARPGMVWVRNIAGEDSNGNAVASQPYLVRGPSGVNFLPFQGMQVWVGLDPEGFDAVQSNVFSDMVAGGFNPSVLNRADPRNELNAFNLSKDGRLFSAPLSVSGGTTKVFVKDMIYVDRYGDLRRFDGAKIDLASYIPASGEHCYAVVGVTIDHALTVAASTAQAMDTALDLTDLNEAIAQLAYDTTPVFAYYLSDDIQAVQQTSKNVDLRSWNNMAPLVGVPYPLDRKLTVPSGRDWRTMRLRLEDYGAVVVKGTVYIG